MTDIEAPEKEKLINISTIKQSLCHIQVIFSVYLHCTSTYILKLVRNIPSGREINKISIDNMISNCTTCEVNNVKVKEQQTWEV